MSSTQLIPLTPGGVPVKVSDGGNTPAGFTLINRGDHGGTITVQAGAGGPAVLLTPGASMTWTDPTTYPVVSVTGSASETLTATNQVSDYANPAAVAAATAVQLAAAGIPNVFTEAAVGDFQIQPTKATAGLPVGGYGSLVVGVSWPQPTPTGPTVLQLTFTDPLVSTLPPISLFLTNNNAIDPGSNVWRVPILGPTLTITNLASSSNAPAFVSVTGNNRTIPGLTQVGEELGYRVFNVSGIVGVDTVIPPMRGRATTRMNGPVTLVINCTQAGTIRGNLVDETGTVTVIGVHHPVGMSTLPLTHPRVPVYWSWQPDTANGGLNLAVVQA